VFLQTEWTWRLFPESGFKVLSPVALTLSVTEIPTASEPIKYHQYHGGSLNDSLLHLAFVVDHYKISQQEIGGDEEHLNEFFGVTVDQILKSIEGTLVYMDYTTYSNRNVCTWRASYLKGEGLVRGQLIIVGDRYYGIQVFGYANEKPDAHMYKFIESFQLLD
jgi:hypothetical protein